MEYLHSAAPETENHFYLMIADEMEDEKVNKNKHVFNSVNN